MHVYLGISPAKFREEEVAGRERDHREGAFYAEKGSSTELPCPCPPCSEQGKEVSWWYYDSYNGTKKLFLKKAGKKVWRGPDAWSRLEMLQNYSLHFHNVTDSDTGRYWCEQLQQKYYDLVVVTGTKQVIEIHGADIVCYLLSCFVPVKTSVPGKASWWEGKEKLLERDEKGGYNIFKVERASLFHICLKKEVSRDEERRRTSERRVKCCFEKMEITFSLTGTAKDCLSACHNQSSCQESRGNQDFCIPLAVCVAVLLLIILVLAVVMWRRSCSQKPQEKPNKATMNSPFPSALFQTLVMPDRRKVFLNHDTWFECMRISRPDQRCCDKQEKDPVYHESVDPGLQLLVFDHHGVFQLQLFPDFVCFSSREFLLCQNFPKPLLYLYFYPQIEEPYIEAVFPQ
ncbi:lymphocyte antigen 6 complex locus protein G6f isoform X2 [Hemicordylus capensis]|uniref:lymphocyte antigen 6 complex locus protein G6f isoform X2 n=1 Tax=Hemicordylus capensis TaxID=884348 RepID=UPI0023031DAF|nr:lymphocyte antigen 6 complex locus protein G6f isoform X2 [Hemicordylus capensis]